MNEVRCYDLGIIGWAICSYPLLITREMFTSFGRAIPAGLLVQVGSHHYGLLDMLPQISCVAGIFLRLFCGVCFFFGTSGLSEAGGSGFLVFSSFVGGSLGQEVQAAGNQGIPVFLIRCKSARKEQQLYLPPKCSEGRSQMDDKAIPHEVVRSLQTCTCLCTF